jgi:hypothetical protein
VPRRRRRYLPEACRTDARRGVSGEMSVARAQNKPLAPFSGLLATPRLRLGCPSASSLPKACPKPASKAGEHKGSKSAKDKSLRPLNPQVGGSFRSVIAGERVKHTTIAIAGPHVPLCNDAEHLPHHRVFAPV